jgi:phosphate:Na+ symporter
LLMALHEFVSLLEPYEDVPSLRLLLGAISTEPLLDVVLAAGLTWAAHSSVAIVLVVMSFAAKGTVPPHAAFALVLGANLGTAINPLLEGGAGADPVARRLPLGNLLNRLLGIALALAALPYLGPWLVTIDPDNARAVADFHTGFNLVLAAVFMPLLKPYAALLQRLLPARVDPADASHPLYLDPSAREVPAIALGGAAREALRLADVLESMLLGLRDTLDKADRRNISATKQLDDVLDKLNAAIKAYVTSLDPESLTDVDHRRANAIFAFATNLEQAGDVVETNLLGGLTKQLKRGVAFSAEGKAELLQMTDRLIANARTAASVFATDDERAARLLAAEKASFRSLEAETTQAHFERLRQGRTDTAESSSRHLDVLRDLKRVNDHLVAAAAYPVLEAKGELLPTRLRQE